jgi:hypothetical protein
MAAVVEMMVVPQQRLVSESCHTEGAAAAAHKVLATVTNCSEECVMAQQMVDIYSCGDGFVGTVGSKWQQAIGIHAWVPSDISDKPTYI